MYSVIKSVNNNTSEIVTQSESFKTAVVNYHEQLKIHWNADDVIIGYIAIVDESLSVVEMNDTRFKEKVWHDPIVPNE